MIDSKNYDVDVCEEIAFMCLKQIEHAEQNVLPHLGPLPRAKARTEEYIKALSDLAREFGATVLTDEERRELRERGR